MAAIVGRIAGKKIGQKLGKKFLSSYSGNSGDSGDSGDFMDKLQESTSKITKGNVIKFFVSIPIGYSIATVLINSMAVLQLKRESKNNGILALMVTLMIIGGILTWMGRKEGWGIIMAGGFVMINYDNFYFQYSKKLLYQILTIVVHIIMAGLLMYFVINRDFDENSEEED